MLQEGTKAFLVKTRGFRPVLSSRNKTWVPEVVLDVLVAVFKEKIEYKQVILI